MVEKKAIDDFYPLSPMQQGMLFHSLYSPGSGMYVEQESYALRGDLNVAALRNAWQRVLERHSILRTAFVGEGLKEPIQRVHRRLDLRFEEEDWRHVPTGECRARLAERSEAVRREGFTLSDPPLFRVLLVRTANEEYELVWTYHHILLDGWSIPVLLQEILVFYDASQRGEDIALPPPRPFRDYIVWLRQQDPGEAEKFWRRTLAGVTAPTQMPLGQVAPASDGANAHYGLAASSLDAVTTAALKEMSRRQQLTLSTVIHGAWALLLRRYCGSSDVVFGTTVSGRPPDLEGSESMVGLFINTLPVRARMVPHDSVSAWLRRFQDHLAELRQYEYSPLVHVHGFSDVPRGTPLFESIVVFENYPTSALADGGGGTLDVRNVRTVEQANYPLALVTGVADELVLQLHHDCRRFDSATANRLLGHLQAILQGIAADPQRRISTVALLSAGERDQLVEHWSGTTAPFPRHKCIHELFEERAAAAPDAVALVFGDEEITYRELNRRANQLAHRLVKNGVGPETMVGICLDRSPEMLAAVMGVLKAGGAYVPLEPGLPRERLEVLLDDTGVPIVLTNEGLTATLPKGTAQVITLDTERQLIERESDANPDVPVTPENLAYVIYTSGSTGRPKGTLLQHRGLCNFVADYVRVNGIGSNSRIFQFFGFGFDGSVCEFFTALSSGAALYMASSETVHSFSELHELLRRRRITQFIMTPSALALLEPDGLTQLKSIVAGGEACTPDVVARWWAPGRRFLNFYGPTEVSVASLRHELPSLPQAGDTIPIGRPVPNDRVYVLDADLQPVPIGVTGEIYLGGVGLARGYLNRPELTAEAFVPDPFGDGTRLYRTGDLGRYRPTGEVEFIGRRDHQVKIRGFRIELGEIESVLRQQPGVQDTVVVAREDVPGDRRLVAYVVSAGESHSDVAVLREGLRSRLPEYMIPTAFVRLDRLPMTTSGKVDRKALPALDGLRPSTAGEYMSPRDAIELQLVRIWEDLLDVRPIGVRDDFFDLGGHSLLAIRVMARIERDLGKRPDMAAIFSARTIESLAVVLREQGASPPETALVGLQTRGSRRPLFFVHPSGGSVHWYVDLSRRLGKKQPFYGLQARGLNQQQELHTRIEDMAAYYVEAIRTVQSEGPYAVGGWSLGVIVAFETARQLYELGDSVEHLFLLDQGPHLPFDEPEDDAAFLVQLFGDHIPLSVDELRELEADAQIAHVLEAAKKIDWIYPEVTVRDFRHFVHIHRTQRRAWRRYSPGQYSGRITLFRSEEQVGGRSSEPDLGWGPLAAGGVEIHDVPGDHLSMMAEPKVKQLAKRIQACLK